MRVIFIQDIAGVAHRDQVREVSDGYALNFLLPKGLAVRANPEKIAAVALRAKAAEQTQVKARIQAEKYAIQLRGRAVTIEARANESGTLYAGVTSADLAPIIKSQFKIDVKADQIVLAQPIKHLGKYQVELKLYEDVTAPLIVVVEGEKKLV
ncbi:MAG: 50S ribosomal protein L9 [Patescibacteria group bacterium]